MREAGARRPRRPIEIVAWTNEEGGRFAPGCMGSMAYAGFRPANAWDAVEDPDGVRFAAALREQLAAESDLPRRPLGVVDGRAAPHAYVEAHIEQGPRLEAEGRDIGVVTGIQGSRWFVVELTGETAHAGTAPLSFRRDAVQDMVRAINALNALMHDPSDVLRFTVGRIEVSPNTSNSVADRVRFTIDFRHPSAAVLRERGDAIEDTVREAVRDCGVVGDGALQRPAGGVQPGGDRRGGARRGGAGLLHAADALRRLPRRAVHRAALPDRHDLRAQPQGHQPQPGGVLRAGAVGEGDAGAGAGAGGAGGELNAPPPANR